MEESNGRFRRPEKLKCPPQRCSVYVCLEKIKLVVGTAVSDYKLHASRLSQDMGASSDFLSSALHPPVGDLDEATPLQLESARGNYARADDELQNLHKEFYVEVQRISALLKALQNHATIKSDEVMCDTLSSMAASLLADVETLRPHRNPNMQVLFEALSDLKQSMDEIKQTVKDRVRGATNYNSTR